MFYFDHRYYQLSKISRYIHKYTLLKHRAEYIKQ